MPEKPRTPEEALQRTLERQRLAVIPDGSAWVSANAGTGKTHVLVGRVLSLLLSGTTRPDRILCLTYTKAAAAEMSNRLFDRMASWATLNGDKLATELAELLARPPAPEELIRARTLFAQAIETPGGLKVQTIHAFAERLLQRFPLEAGIPPGFSVLDDDKRRGLVREAVDAVLLGARSDGAERLAQAIDDVAAFAVGERFDEVLTQLIGRRAEIRLLLGSVDEETDGEDRAPLLHRLIAAALDVPARATEESLLDTAARLLGDDELAMIEQALKAGKPTDLKCAEALGLARRARGAAARVEALAAALLTQKGEPRSTLMTKAVAEESPALLLRLEETADALARLRRQRQALKVAHATAAMLEIADAAIGAYEASKQEAGLLDYDDLIDKTVRLLSQSIDAQWVLYKLDGGLDHILVDEAQDTSPEAWQIVRALAVEFFASPAEDGAGRTVFAVGDEKQSIYGFQGARPKEFATHGRRFQALAEQAGATFRSVSLDVSFRSVPAVLEAVDRVFADRGRTPGLTSGGDPIRHIPRRADEPGLIELWPVEIAETPGRPLPWKPSAAAETVPPMRRLADRIAHTIRSWLDSRETLPSGRPIRPNDILILVRRRNPFAPEIIKALKSAGIAVAGADRIRIAEQIAVEDLMALGDFLLLPEDDLALAAVLKSPLCGLDDGDLMTIGLERRGSLWAALLSHAEHGASRLVQAAERLRRWRSRADYLPPFEFFASVIDSEGLRADMLARLGPEAGDALDAFLALALSFDETEPPSLQGFLDWVRRAGPEIRRDMEQARDEVRVMTVHGAKGLEAPIVFLPDTCLAPGGGQEPIVDLNPGPLPEGAARPFVWLIKGAGEVEAVAAAKETQRVEARHEFHRLLYVALTRARDRLYIAGYAGPKGRPQGCWYDLVEAGMGALLDEVALADGTTVRRYRDLAAERPIVPADEIPVSTPALRPAWAGRRARTEETRVIPLRPSQLAPVESEEGSGYAVSPRPGEPPAASPSLVSGSQRFLRGTLAHTLLEHLPALKPSQRRKAAMTYLEQAGGELPDKARKALADEVVRVLGQEDFAAVFGTGSLAEVPIIGEIALPGGGPPLRITGQIDRLVVLPDAVVLVDFKTNRPPPRALADVPRAYLLQLSAYRLILNRIYEDRPVRAALLWTSIPELMPIPGHLLDMAERELLAGVPWA